MSDDLKSRVENALQWKGDADLSCTRFEMAQLIKDLWEREQKLVEALREQRDELYKAIDNNDLEVRVIKDRREPFIEAMCEEFGYGAVISGASRLWQKKDKVGAFIVTECVGTARSRLERMEATLKELGVEDVPETNFGDIEKSETRTGGN